MKEKIEEETKKKRPENPEKKQEYQGKLVRIMSGDIDSNNTIYHGLTKIKGISWSMSNAICHSLKLDKKRKIGSLSPEEIQKIIDFIKSPKIPSFLMNRRKDFETGEDKHLASTSLELQHEFDIKRMRKIRSYKGYRHAMGLPVRGQRTRGHFRKNKKKSVGIKKRTQGGGPVKNEKKA